MSTSLFTQFHGDRVDQSELESIFLSYFSSGTGVTPTEIAYRHEGDEYPALSLKYNKDGRLRDVLVGQGLRQEDIDTLSQRVEEECVKVGSPTVGRQVAFARAPVTGWFRYKNIFQLVPVPTDCPQAPHLGADHPLLLEVAYPSSTNSGVNGVRLGRVLHEIDLMLGAILKSYKGRVSNIVRQHWTIKRSNEDTQFDSEFMQEGYVLKGDPVTEADGFSSLQTLSSFARITFGEYYRHRYITVGQGFTLPDNFEQLLDSYFDLSTGDRDRFLRASYWWRHAEEVYNYSKSAAFVALVSSVEALMPPPQAAGQCETCRRSYGKGPTQFFAEFVENYVSDESLSEKERKRFYALRSALSHGGKLLHHDRSVLLGFTSSQIQEWGDLDVMWTIVQILLVEWLLERNP